jgi:hypothetical protein
MIALLRARALAVLVAGSISGCMTGDGMQTKLRDASTEYNKSLRWRDLDRAAEWLPADSQQAFLARQDEYAKELIVLDYELTRLDLDKRTGVAASRAQIWWHTDDSTVVETTTVDQLWQFHEGKFVLVDERRGGGTRLGLFAEHDGEHPYLPGLQRYRKVHDIGVEKDKLGRRKKPQPEPSIHWPTKPARESGPEMDPAGIGPDAAVGSDLPTRGDTLGQLGRPGESER